MREAGGLHLKISIYLKVKKKSEEYKMGDLKLSAQSSLHPPLHPPPEDWICVVFFVDMIVWCGIAVIRLKFLVKL